MQTKIPVTIRQLLYHQNWTLQPMRYE